jgi:hypothetical protein
MTNESAIQDTPREASVKRRAGEQKGTPAAAERTPASPSSVNFNRGEPIERGSADSFSESGTPRQSPANSSSSSAPEKQKPDSDKEDSQVRVREKSTTASSQETQNDRAQQPSSRVELPTAEAPDSQTKDAPFPHHTRTAETSSTTRIYIGTVEVRTTNRPPEPPQPPATPAQRPMAQAPAPPLARSLAWRYGLIQS